jgi:hypothetical protein
MSDGLLEAGKSAKLILDDALARTSEAGLRVS